MALSASRVAATPAAETLLKVGNLSFWYGDPDRQRPVLDRVSLSMNRGETLALVGESGSGKSTLINCIIGLHSSRRVTLRADALRFADTDLLSLDHRGWRSLRGRRIAYVSQDPAGSLNPLATVGDQIVEILRIYRPELSRRDARSEALSLMARFGFSDPQQVFVKYPHQLSGGMNQRISIAAALCGEPDLLLADEPTSALDVSVQKRVLDHMADLVARTGTSLLFITHDLAVAADRAERIIVLQNGSIVEEGGVRAVITAPRHAYTRDLLGAAPFLREVVAGEPPAEPVAPQAVPDGAALLAVRKLHKSFTARDGRLLAAVNGVSLDLRQGETVCVVGESGSGKTTLARTILKLAEADAGEIRFNGYDIPGLSGVALRQYRREAQMVYQNPFASLDLRYSVDAILREPLEIHRIGDRAAQRVAARRMLDLVGLPASFLDRRPGELSGGQRQRVAIARALVTSPKLLVLDEAVSALDVSVQARILDLLQSIQRELGIAYLFITHDLAVVRSFSHRVYVMKQGEVVESGETATVFDAPRHDYTRLLIAAAPGQLAREKL